MGYQNWWQVLNAKDYGVPQNRERVFVVSILGGGQYLFPNPIKLDKRLKDILESNVDEKYYLSDRYLDYIKGKESKEYNFRVETSDIQGIRETPLRSGGDRACIQEPLCVASRGRENGQELEFQKEPISNTLTSVQKDNYVVEPKIIEEDFNLYPNSGNPQAGRVYNAEGISPAMDTCSGGNRMPKITSDYRIRKLTPRECWRLMGVRDEQFDKISGISHSQLYKLAGNSIVVDVLMGIFKNMFLENDSKGQLTLL